MRRHHVVWMLLLLIPLLLTGCGKNGVEPPSGSPIVLEPENPGGGGNVTMIWKSSGDTLTAGNTILDSNQPADFCKLRDDFIGEGVNHFRFTYDDLSQKNPAATVTLKNNTLKITIAYQGKAQPLSWNIEMADGTMPCGTTGLEPDPTKRNSMKVPPELMGFVRDQVEESSNPAKGAKTHELEVNWPSEGGTP